MYNIKVECWSDFVGEYLPRLYTVGLCEVDRQRLSDGHLTESEAEDIAQTTAVLFARERDGYLVRDAYFWSRE